MTIIIKPKASDDNALSLLSESAALAVNTAPQFRLGDGKVTTAVGAFADRGYSVAIQSNGKIVVAGLSFNGLHDDFALTRYNVDGSLDASFNGTGKVTTAVGLLADSGYALSLQADGKILVAGTSNNGSNEDFALVRYNLDGSLDSSFNGTGKASTDLNASQDYATSVTLQNDGKILLAGYSGDLGTENFALVRYNSDGSLDNGFDGDGKVITPVGLAYDQGRSVIVQSDGKILVGGYSSVLGNADFSLVRYQNDGSLDSSFGAAGKVITSISPSYDNGYAMTLQADGKILLAGSSSNDFALVRYNNDGSLDNSFAQAGIVTTAIGTGYDVAYAVTTQTDGKILVAGASNTGSRVDFALVRYHSDGSLDSSFDGDGKVTTAMGASDSIGYALTVQADGKILLTGRSHNGSNDDIALARYHADGSLDVTFDAHIPDATVDYTENQPPILLDSTVQIDDVEFTTQGHYAGASITLVRHGGANSQDVFSSSGNLSFVGNEVRLSGVSIGTLTSNSNGVLSLQFNNNATLARVNEALSSFTYSNTAHGLFTTLPIAIDWTFSDGNAATTANSYVNVHPLNTPPTASDNVLSLAEDSTYRFAIGDFGFHDVNGDTLTSIKISSLLNTGGLKFNGVDVTVNQIINAADIANLSFTPPSNAYSNDYARFNFTVNDGLVDSLTANTIQLNVTAVNDAPVAQNDELTANEDTSIVYNAPQLLINDSDIDANTLKVIAVNSGSGGVAWLNQNGSVSFTPAPHFNGLASFTYQVSDGALTSNTATATIAVSAINDAPVAQNDELTAIEDTPLIYNAAQLLGNDSDIDGDALTIIAVNSGNGGTVILNSDGFVHFTSNADFNGLASFVYQVSDGGLISNTATATIAVSAINDAPVAQTDELTAIEDTSLIYSAAQLLSNDSDSEGDKLTIATISNATGGIAQLNNDGTVSFTPNAHFNGLASFAYQISDGLLISNNAIATINVIATNDAPTAQDDALIASEDTPMIYSAAQLLSNDSDIDGDKLTIAAISHAAGGIAALNNDGSVSFTPNADFNGLATFSYQVSDGALISNTATVGVVVNALNDAPIAENDELTAIEDTPQIYSAAQLLSNDHDIDDDTLSIATIENVTGGIAILNSDGTVSFTPNSDFNGVAEFRYQTTDGQSLSNFATASINIAEINDAPVAQNDTLTAIEDTPALFTAEQLLSNDSDLENNTLRIVAVASGANGQAVLNADGTLSFMPNPDFNGLNTFSYQIDDGNSISNSAQVTVDVMPSNDSPTGSPFIKGVTQVAKTLEADTSAISDVDGLGVFSYQWLINHTIVSNNNSSTYLLTDKEIGKTLSVIVSYIDANGTVETLTSLPSNSIVANAGDNTLTGSKADDRLFGLTGNDVLVGGMGNDSLNGGAGDDTLLGGMNSDSLNGGKGDDLLNGGTGDDTLIGGGGINTLNGGSGDDVIFTENALQAKSARISSGGDSVDGGSGNDSIVGGSDGGRSAQGSDHALVGGSGNDTIRGGSGDDTIVGGSDNGRASNDGDDSLDGGAGNDDIYGNDGNDILNGLSGNDSLQGGMGDDTLNGGVGNDVLTGGAGANHFVFDASVETKNTDEIIDFNVIYDTIQLKNSVFSALELGILPASAFTVNALANEAAQHVIYDKTSGMIFYDDDGNGANAAQPIVSIGINLELTHTHFIVV